ncbi:MAG: cobalamin B12-binding domain-containing protein, partial [Candidatus Shapirobacteria bacterium]|nr:cobalamin B12-binding domain-containing protein [Candidatus Shapirobacteria bacterium]
MLDVLLINPSISYANLSEDMPDDNYHHYPPLGYLYLAATLRQKGFKVDVVDTSTNLTLNQTLTLIKRKKPKIIGLSAMLANMRGAYQLAIEIKKKIRPSPVIILGGHHVSSDPTIIKRFPC